MSTALASSSPRARVTPPLPAVRAILRVDGLRLVRDRFLIGTVVYIIAVSVAMRWIIPFATNQLAVRLGFDLTPYHGLITSHFVVQLAAMVGGVAGGFLILESKENRVIAAFRVTPVSFASYVAILGLVLVAATELIAVVEALIVGIGTPPLVPLALTALAGAPASVIFALVVGTFATTKTEAFAYLKFIGLAPLLPTASYFLAEPWQYAMAVYPPYWASKAYWLALEGGSLWPILVVGGLMMSGIFVVGLTHIFLRRVAR
jgi:fluoroquinolone transport system permease protein